jgi:hypothetical protein
MLPKVNANVEEKIRADAVRAVRIGVDQFPDREAVRRLFGVIVWLMGCSSELVGSDRLGNEPL